MRMRKHTLASNFPLIGKTSRFLATTALTAAGIVAISGPAFADNWTDHAASEGSISIDTSIANQTNITQGTDFVKVHGDGDINAGWTVNVAQPSSRAKYVLYDTEADPTKIMGALNANGRVYIFDKNGVIFGEGSQVNVGSIIASTGTASDESIKADRPEFVNVGGDAVTGEKAGAIINNGTITVAEAGIAAFVAPSVINNGLIVAHKGSVVLASGEKVTLDFYGDKLVEIAANGALEDALIQNSGTINAAGGTVVMSASAAKNAVDNVINMDGIIDVSSASVKGGKIILSGGSKGMVRVSGKAKASGTSGGDISITGQNVDVTSTARLSSNAAVNGDGGNIYVYGNDFAIFRGRISARGGASSGNGGNAEISAGESVGYLGLADLSADYGETGTLLIDPRILNIGNYSKVTMAADIVNDFVSGGNSVVRISDRALAKTLRFSNVNLWATQRINTTSEVDISTWIKKFISGITTNDLTLSAPVINIQHDIILGTGDLNIYDMVAGTDFMGIPVITVPAGGINVDRVNLNGTIYRRDAVGGATIEAGDDQINSHADYVYVQSNAARIQQGVYLADDGGGATVRVEPGLYNESITVPKSMILLGANSGIDPLDPARGPETMIKPNSPGFHVTADNVTINGFMITGADRGVFVDNADNVVVQNNFINNSSENGIHIVNSEDVMIRSNNNP